MLLVISYIKIDCNPCFANMLLTNSIGLINQSPQ
ncbi:hypothetical protein F383_13258 [Gossypium arboreum]|uniref:Uncharacterized protein n=1 Tax=Gossypium arboreum TaxID=29729 RepID=A0A0B0PSB6_GOSAR|nr:hypothetical protein F383_13258 [Gossypium arboreum]